MILELIKSIIQAKWARLRAFISYCGMCWKIWRSPVREPIILGINQITKDLVKRYLPNERWCDCGGLYEPKLIGDEWHNICVSCGRSEDR